MSNDTQPGTRAVVLLAHGSRDPRAAQTVDELTASVAARLPLATVRAAYLDHTAPSALDALIQLAGDGETSVRVVPLLFAPGFHIRSDLPGVLEQARTVAPRLLVSVAPTLAERAGDPVATELLLDALDRRLPPGPELLVLAAAGSSDPDARAVVHSLAEAWGARRGVPTMAAFASGPGDRPDAAILELSSRHERPSTHVGVGSLFLADGYLPGRVARSAASCGASCADVLGAAPELVRLVLRRAVSDELVDDMVPTA